ncbi:MAG: protein-L-isoaspartate(D-aspartate) O-methyltransferase [Bacteroidales bacterium]|nr:protein-L-isoaspartate(D-aspartate) O-methyltransferase [Bacteroidales bacterium]MCF8346219.1 protein-L-isoaspartate(D-aspartate) O-methyltransferase [Bacteroidales bacterium]MCF8376632.1 protein-L-isoaspartate(D-aspartate) O-methyltransferase [Bacteroidales bacterium]MCF8400646.1 protein-L-isoaspartate(D-aspartate) O-methyltransferase [Bacteroidales bacterium]
MTSKDQMIERQLRGRDIKDPEVIRAMREVDRRLFVPDDIREYAYVDEPLPIGKGQTISQPYIVAFMAQNLELNEDDVVLEIGSGCGYNAAVLSRIVKQVYSIEIVEWLADLARNNLQKAGIRNVEAIHGDGYKGWPGKAPFDKIMLTASTPKIPEPLKQQLKIEGLLIAPVSDSFENLVVMRKKDEDDYCMKDLLPVRFVPMTGQVQKPYYNEDEQEK